MRVALLGVLGILPSSGMAQAPLEQPTPFTVWLPLKELAEGAQPAKSFPIWLENVEINEMLSADQSTVLSTTYRIQLRKLPGLSDHLLLRLFFEDTPEARPRVAVWSELGDRLSLSNVLGSGLGIATSEMLELKTADAAYIEIEVPGRGEGIYGAFVSSLRQVETRQAMDFELAHKLIEPFQASLPGNLGFEDRYLFGRVKALLDVSPDGKVQPVKITPEQGGVTFAFELESQPEVAVVHFEVLGGDIGEPPLVSSNGSATGNASLILPDLADPAYAGSVRPGEADVRFQYRGWLKCQKLIPGSKLKAGENILGILLPGQRTPVAVRAVEIELKYHPSQP